MTTITLYDNTHLTGNHVVIDKDTPDLAGENFAEKAQSLEVNGDPWIAFTRKHYLGDFSVFESGKHNTIRLRNSFFSVRKTGPLKDPEITVYEDVNYQGKHQKLTSGVPSLCSIGMSRISSYKTHSGVWILYETVNYNNQMEVVPVAGDNVQDITKLTNKHILSLKPLEDCDLSNLNNIVS
ncbi:gamma-crystallin N-like [Pelobates fuscus]|uniref:gamma-crystallin N-like n=1 Tax=Pelobates fuscus TaxID=191477 RepID=UPI002FE4A69C